MNIYASCRFYSFEAREMKKKELELAREAAIKAKLIAEGKLVEKANEAYITADFDAADDAVVVF